MLRAFMERESGVVLSDDQRYLFEARLTPVARTFGLTSLRDVVLRAATGPRGTELAQAVVDAMTTHETLFFRDPGFWKHLEDVIVPALLTGAPGGRLRIWSAACSHGQEPYSLAMLLDERWPDVAQHSEIIATDISAPAIARAQEGRFSTLEINRGLGASRLVRHLEQEAGAFRVKKRLRDRIQWSVHNLVGANPDPSGCHLVLCRNVLIYFAEHDRKAALRRMERALVPRGWLGLGSTEMTERTPTAPGWYLIDANDPAKASWRAPVEPDKQVPARWTETHDG